MVRTWKKRRRKKRKRKKMAKDLFESEGGEDGVEGKKVEVREVLKVAQMLADEEAQKVHQLPGVAVVVVVVWWWCSGGVMMVVLW